VDRLLACDYDGTLAFQGCIEPAALAAVSRWRAAGGRFAIVTGRTLEDLFGHFGHKELLDAVVAEDGAVVWNTKTGDIRTLAEGPPVDFVADLQRRGVPIIAGRVTLYTLKPHDEAVRLAILERGIKHHIVLNWDAVMILPPGINKAFGCRAMAMELGIPMDRVAAIGDGENDHSLLRACGQSAAVANAVPSLKEVAKWVMRAERGEGVAEFVDRLLVPEVV
jgi:hydroxymethylpyrimidine pyrophosphatase-like HAD family hydrolase